MQRPDTRGLIRLHEDDGSEEFQTPRLSYHAVFHVFSALEVLP